MGRSIVVADQITIDLETGQMEGAAVSADVAGRLPDSALRILRALARAGDRFVAADELSQIAWPGEDAPAMLVERTLRRLSERLPGALVERGDRWQLCFEQVGSQWQVRVMAPDESLFAIPVKSPLSIGRSPDNGLVLAAAEVSRYHATLRSSSSALEIEDRGSGNGIYVDGRRVERAALTHGQSFEIRPYRLQVFRMAPEEHKASPTTQIVPLTAQGRLLTLTSCVVDLEEKRVTGPDGESALTATEAALLVYLAQAAPRTVLKEELLAQVWGYHPSVQSRTVDTTVYRLRMKIERDAREPEHLLTVRGEGYRLLLAPEEALAGQRTNLPEQPSPLYGRESELHELARLLEERAVVEVIGPPGIGKTRLARTAASLWAKDPQHREVWYVELSGVSDARELCARIGRTLGTELPNRDALRWIASRRGPLLVVLDGADRCEEPLAALLAEPIPGLRWLVSARGALSAGETERILRLSGLEIAAARTLFRDVAGEAALPGHLDDSKLDPLLDQLGCNPLAIELAARWAAVLPPDALRERLSELLPEGSVLRAAIAAAYDRLSPQSQRVLSQCAVFASALSLRDALVVLDSSIPNVLQEIRALCRAAMMEPVADREARFRVPTPVRSFLLEQGLPDTLRARHALRFTDQSREAHPEDTDDLRNAASFALSCGDIPLASAAICRLLAAGADARAEIDAVRSRSSDDLPIELSLAVAEQHLAYGDLDAARATLSQTSPVEARDSAQRARLLASIARAEGRLDLAKELIARAHGEALDPKEIALVELEMARIASASGEPDAEERFRTVAARLRASGPPEREASILEALAEAAARRGASAAEALWTEAIRLYREAKRASAEASALLSYGEWLNRNLRGDEARVIAEDALKLSGARGLRHRGLRLLGDISATEGDPLEAALHYERALKAALEDGRHQDVLSARLRLATQSLLDGEPSRALTSAYAGIADAHVSMLQPPDGLHGVIAVARARSGNPSAARAALDALDALPATALGRCLAGEAAALLGEHRQASERLGEAALLLGSDPVERRLFERLERLLQERAT